MDIKLFQSNYFEQFCLMLAIKKLIPHLFTAGNLVGGMLAIIFALNGNLMLAPFCIFASAIFDFLDGFVARLLKVPSELGKQLDSLADMVTFGVAPGIIMFQLINLNLARGFNNSIHATESSEILISGKFFYTDTVVGHVGQIGQAYTFQPIEFKTYLAFFAFLIPVLALFRLAKFNLDTRQSDSFIGLPTPAMTIFIAAIPLMMLTIQYDWQMWIHQHVFANKLAMASICILLSVLMVVPLPLFALKFKDFKFKGNAVRYIFLTISAILLITLLWWSLPIIIILYVILSLVVKPKKNEIQS